MTGLDWRSLAELRHERAWVLRCVARIEGLLDGPADHRCLLSRLELLNLRRYLVRRLGNVAVRLHELSGGEEPGDAGR